MLEYPLKEEKERRKYAKLNELKTTAGDIFTYYNVLKWQENIFLLFKGQLWNYGTGSEKDGANVQGIILGARQAYLERRISIPTGKIRDVSVLACNRQACVGIRFLGKVGEGQHTLMGFGILNDVKTEE
ncbi:hypothetical protein ACO22_03965 [Paracoccidioides brasiliensis]|uniref:Uncharacterized protein n=1 Tax=Paracoccidioides brasiliensis TaxID=121759 RepID=A0A1D2JEH9_PARBR|nr:hypothetical protein ACO22_03965 [Paracoccidioides brasiliensis]